MNQQHFIESTDFTINFSSEDIAFDEQNYLSDLLENELMPIADQAFSEIIYGDQIVKIERLELDLGNFEYNQYKTEIIPRFKKCLFNKLNEIVSDIGNQERHSGVTVVDSAISNIEVITDFFEYGFNQWNSNIQNIEELERRINKALDDQTIDVLKFLNSRPDKALMSIRIVNQLTDQMLQKLLKVYVQGNPVIIVKLIECLEEKLIGVKNMPVNNLETNRFIWARVICYLTTNKVESVSIESVIDFILGDISPYLKLNSLHNIPTELGSYLRKYTRSELEVNSHFVGESDKGIKLEKIHQISDDFSNQYIQRRNNTSVTDTRSIEINVGISAVNTVKHILAKEVHLIPDVTWFMLVKDYPDQLIEVFRSLGKKTKWYADLTSILPFRVQNEFIRLLSAGKSSFIKNIINSPIILGALLKINDSDNNISRHYLYKITIDYLIEKIDEQFSNVNYIEYMLNKISQNLSVNKDVLTFELSHNIQHSLLKTKQDEEFVGLLNPNREKPTEPTLSTVDYSIELDKLINGHEVYEKLLELATTTSESNYLNLENILCLTSEEYPVQLKRFISELKFSSNLFHLVISSLDFTSLRLLIFKILQFNAELSGEKPNLEEFIINIQVYAKQSTNQKVFYSQLLNEIVQNEVVDLERLSELEFTELRDYNETSKNDFTKKIKFLSRVDTEELELIGKKLELSSEEIIEYIDDCFLLSDSLTNDKTLQLQKYLQLLLIDKVVSFEDILREYLINKNVRNLLIKILPESELVKMVKLYGADQQKRLLGLLDMMNLCCMEFVADPLLLKSQKWHIVLSNLSNSVNDTELVKKYINSLPKHVKSLSFDEILENVSVQLRSNPKIYSQNQSSSILEIIKRVQHKPLDQPINSILASDEKDTVENIYIQNAGLVIIAPYLPQLLSKLHLVDKGRFISQESAERAIHLIQYLNNESVDTFEAKLVLNKLLCGVKPGYPILRKIDVTDTEVEILDSLLTGIISQWKSIGNVSINGLRESFLQREGRLRRKEKNWELFVQAKPYDMLVDQVPWSFNTIKLPWMTQIINVTWR